MSEDEAKEKNIAYFERVGIDFKIINFARVVFRVEAGEIADHKFLDDSEPNPTCTITSTPKKDYINP